MDQLSVHKSNDVKEILEKLKFRYLYNAAYYPDGNGIEYIFAKVKHSFKKLRIYAILNGKRDRVKVQLTKAFNEINRIDCEKAIAKSLNNINNF